MYCTVRLGHIRNHHPSRHARSALQYGLRLRLPLPRADALLQAAVTGCSWARESVCYAKVYGAPSMCRGLRCSIGKSGWNSWLGFRCSARGTPDDRTSTAAHAVLVVSRRFFHLHLCTAPSHGCCAPRSRKRSNTQGQTDCERTSARLPVCLPGKCVAFGASLIILSSLH